MSSASFARMEDSTAQDWRVMGGEFAEHFRGHAHFARTEEFCALYDNPAFDPKAEALPLSEFEPLVRRVFGSVRNSVYKAAIASPASA